MPKTPEKPANQGKLHPRNLHQGFYNFDELEAHCADLKKHFKLSPNGRTTIDFSNNQAVIALNQALLAKFYQVKHWGFNRLPLPADPWQSRLHPLCG